MSVFKTTFSRALRAIPSDTIGIPFPGLQNASGTNTLATVSKLVNTAGGFTTKNILVGDIVYNDTAGTIATVTAIDSATQISLSANIFTTTAQNYSIYSASAPSGASTTGCYIYVGAAGNVTVLTLGGDVVLFSAVPAGTVLPIQVLRINSTGTVPTAFTAMW